jgi:hypothetical protein
VDPEVGGSNPPNCTSKPLSLHGKSRDESAPSNSNFSSALYTAVGARRSRSRYQRRFLLCPHCGSFIATFQRHVANRVLRVRTHYWVPVRFPRTATLRSTHQKPRGAPRFRALCVSNCAVETPLSGNFRARGPPVSTSRLETSSSGSKWRSKFCVQPAPRGSNFCSSGEIPVYQGINREFSRSKGQFARAELRFKPYNIEF